MTLDEIITEWKIDAPLDKLDVGTAALNVPMLHHKYMTMLSKENLLYKKKQHELAVLMLEKYEFYENGPTEETNAKGWFSLYPKGKAGRILKTEIERFLNADPDIIKLSLSVSYQEEKVTYLKAVIKSLDGRNYSVQNYINHEKFMKGNL